MLDAHRCDQLCRHLAEVTVQLGDILRDSVSSRQLGWQVSALLLNTACRTKAATSADGSAPESPEMRLHGFRDGEDTRIGALLDREADWFADNPEFWADYGSELLRTTAGRWRDDLLTSRALQQVVEAVPTAASTAQDRNRVGVLDIACGGGTLLATAADVFGDRDVFLAGHDRRG